MAQYKLQQRNLKNAMDTKSNTVISALPSVCT